MIENVRKDLPTAGNGYCQNATWLWGLLSVLIVCCALALMASVAFNELTTGAGVTVFVGMASLFLTFVCATRRPLGMSVLACLLFGPVILLNEVKYSYLREMIHPIDFYLLLSWIGNDLSFLSAYGALIGSGALALATVVVGALVLWKFEGWVLPDTIRKLKLRRPIIVFASIAAFYWIAFFSGSYLSSAVALSYYSQLTINTGPRLSYFQMAIQQMHRIRSELATLSKYADEGSSASDKKSLALRKSAGIAPI